MIIITWILFGALTGWVISLIISGKADRTMQQDILLGIVGAVAGGFAALWLGLASTTDFDGMSLLLAIVGAIITVTLFNTLQQN